MHCQIASKHGLKCNKLYFVPLCPFRTRGLGMAQALFDMWLNIVYYVYAVTTSILLYFFKI